MNERIEELRIQALRWSGENVNRTLYSDYEIQLKEYEKFAELIVRDVLDEVLQAMDDGMDVYDTVADKFGVEE